MSTFMNVAAGPSDPLLRVCARRKAAPERAAGTQKEGNELFVFQEHLSNKSLVFVHV